MQQVLSFAGRTLRPARIAIVGFGTIAQVHCRYLLSERGTGEEDTSIIMVFPGIHDTPGDSWPPAIRDPLFSSAASNASLLFVSESVCQIQPMPGKEGSGYILETSQETYQFGDVYLEPGSLYAA